jgi:hypothetical protein
MDSVRSRSDDEFGVDVVPAVRMGSRWAIPRHDRELWKSPDAGERWREADPEKLTELSAKLNEKVKVDGQGAYVPVVKLVRQTRRHHRGDEKPGGFYFELMTYWTFMADLNGDSFAELFAATLRSLATQLASSTPLTDPALDKPYKPEPDPDGVQWLARRSKHVDRHLLRRLASHTLSLHRSSFPVPGPGRSSAAGPFLSARRT